MMASSVLPEIANNMPDILDSIGATDLHSADSSCLALKSVCNFVVSYCGHFADILSRVQNTERSPPSRGVMGTPMTARRGFRLS